MTEYHDPAWVVQRAWSVYRLPALQELINRTIAELELLAPSELLGRELSSFEESPCNPVAEALKACSEELRDACGMADSHEQRALHCGLVRSYMTQQPVAWQEAFVEALDKYRRAASQALLASFDAQAAAAS